MILNIQEWVNEDVWELVELLDAASIKFGFKNDKSVLTIDVMTGSVEVFLNSTFDIDAITLNEKTFMGSIPLAQYI